MSFRVGENMAGSVITYRPEIIAGYSHFGKEFVLRWCPGEHCHPGRGYEQAVPRSALSSDAQPGVLHPQGLRKGGEVQGARWRWQHLLPCPLLWESHVFRTGWG